MFDFQKPRERPREPREYACLLLRTLRLVGCATLLFSVSASLEAQSHPKGAPTSLPKFIQQDVYPAPPEPTPLGLEDRPAESADRLLSGGEEAITSWLYAVDSGANDDSSSLYRVGVTASGGWVELGGVGETGIRNIFDIAFMGSRLFGLAYDPILFGTLDGVLLELDPANGNATVLGRIDSNGTLNSLVGESATTLLAASTTGEVWRINPIALTAQRIGNFGTIGGSSGDLAFGLDGTLYGVTETFASDRLVRVNTANGTATDIGAMGFGDVYGLAVDPGTGALMAVVSGDDQPRLGNVNKATGATTLIGRIPWTDITGLATTGATVVGNPCVPSPTSFCLSGGRFRARVEWISPTGASGSGQAVDFSPARADSGAFWFFDRNNIEMVVKVLDACSINNRFWVFAGGLTNVYAKLIIEDTRTGQSRVYENPQGAPYQPIQDVGAFATCP